MYELSERTVDTIVGLDLSLNGPGFCSIDLKTGCAQLCGFVSTTKKFTTVDPSSLPDFSINPYGSYLRGRNKKNKTRPADENPDLYNSYRRAFVFKCWKDFLARHNTDKVIVVQENYAYNTQNAGQFELAEISGLIREDLWQRWIPLRLHEPMSVKQWATDNATAKKIHMRDAAEKLGFTLDDTFFKEVKSKHPFFHQEKYRTTDVSGPGADIVDAFHLADFGRVEVLARMHYAMELSAKQTREFEKTSKAHPISLLERPFIYRTEEYDI
jgi:hypothetical protein